MNICFIAGTLGQGGAERQLYYYVKTLTKNGINSYVLCTTKGDYWEKHLRELGIDVIWVGKSENQLRRLATIVKEISKRPTDIIHSQHFHANLYSYGAGLLLNKKVVGSVRSDVYSEIVDAGPLGKLCFSLPKLLAVNSKAAIENAVKLGKPRQQLFLLPNVVDETVFVPGDQKINNDKFRVLYIGTLKPPKRVDRIIKIAKRCLDENLKIEFKIIGDGVEKFQLIELAENIGVNNKNIYFDGAVINPVRAYRNADLLLLSSDREGTPNVILEAMSCGLPIISTKVGDVPDLIQNYINGFVTDLNNEDELFVRLKELYHDRKLVKKMGDSNREKILQEKSISTLSYYLVNLYNN